MLKRLSQFFQLKHKNPFIATFQHSKPVDYLGIPLFPRRIRPRLHPLRRTHARMQPVLSFEKTMAREVHWLASGTSFDALQCRSTWMTFQGKLWSRPSCESGDSTATKSEWANDYLNLKRDEKSLTMPKFRQSRRSLRRSVRFLWMMRCLRVSLAKSNMYCASCCTDASRPMYLRSTM